MTELKKDNSCWRCEHTLMVKCIDEYHHIGGGMLQCDHEDGGGATRHYQAGDYCQFCGTRLDI